ncbi:MAG: ISL3 family transposase, partial [Nitrospirales bacterium]|nr:ISL3 family transposase [Nitrospirales bacterium]
MESKELYRHLLGINEPWTVERVHLDLPRGQVDVFVEHTKGARFPCPECGRVLT